MKLRNNSIHLIDVIVRNVRTEIEEGAKRLAKERGETEATSADVIDSATIMFESDHRELLRIK